MSEIEIYIEQGCDIGAFERDVNTALEKLCKTREIVCMEYKTGLDHKVGERPISWYTVAIEHRRKVSYEYEKMTSSIESHDNMIEDLVEYVGGLSDLVKAQGEQLSLLMEVERRRKEDAKKEREKKSKVLAAKKKKVVVEQLKAKKRGESLKVKRFKEKLKVEEAVKAAKKSKERIALKKKGGEMSLRDLINKRKRKSAKKKKV